MRQPSQCAHVTQNNAIFLERTARSRTRKRTRGKSKMRNFYQWNKGEIDDHYRFERQVWSYQYLKERGFYFLHRHEAQMINFSIRKRHNRRTIEKKLIRSKWEIEKHKQSHHLIFPAKFTVQWLKGLQLIRLDLPVDCVCHRAYEKAPTTYCLW